MAEEIEKQIDELSKALRSLMQIEETKRTQDQINRIMEITAKLATLRGEEVIDEESEEKTADTKSEDKKSDDKSGDKEEASDKEEKTSWWKNKTWKRVGYGIAATATVAAIITLASGSKE